MITGHRGAAHVMDVAAYTGPDSWNTSAAGLQTRQPSVHRRTLHAL